LSCCRSHKKHHDVLVTSARGDRKSSGVNLARWLEGVDKCIVGSIGFVVAFLVLWRGCAGLARRLLGGLRVFILLTQVAFAHGVGFGKVIFDKFICEAGPGGEETSFNGCQPGEVVGLK
jgi:hypothetical protein